MSIEKSISKARNGTDLSHRIDKSGSCIEPVTKKIYKSRSKKAIRKSDGWGNLTEEYTYSVLEEIERLKYEIDHCVKGAYTNIYDYGELAKYIRGLADELNEFADTVEYSEDEDEDEEDDY